MNPIDIALRIATSAHAGQLDCDGYPVILHPLTVGLMGHTDEEKMAGFLHDVVEDTSYSFEDLLHEGIPTGVVNALRILTHKPGTDYFDYVQSIIDSQNPIALQVKYNDLQHNFQRGKDYPDLQKKHGKALEMIKAAIEKCSQVDIYHAPEDCSIEVGIFACGCFWGAQHQFQKQPGVLNTLAGYTGGKEAFPSYADVRDHKTHHVEAVIVEFNPQQVSRSCIFYRNESQKQTAEHVTELLRSKGDEVNTLLLPEETFYIGEAYHQHYYEKTGGEPYCHLRTKKF